MLNGEMEMKRSQWRQQAIEGTISAEDMKEWCDMVRAGRRAAATAPKKASTKTVVDSKALMDELDGVE